MYYQIKHKCKLFAFVFALIIHQIITKGIHTNTSSRMQDDVPKP